MVDPPVEYLKMCNFLKSHIFPETFKYSLVNYESVFVFIAFPMVCDEVDIQ